MKLTKVWEEITREEFTDFLANYPRPLTPDITGMCQPTLAAYYDFEAAERWNAMVAKYHLGPDVTKYRYYVKRGLL